LKKNRKTTLILRFGLIFLSVILLLFFLFFLFTRITPPIPVDRSSETFIVNKLDSNFSSINQNWLKRSETGLWEMYIQGKPYERGVINGKLSKELIISQEKAFIDEIARIIPSGFYRHFLKYFIYLFNRNLDKYLTEEYKLEIYGISQSASPEFSFIGNNYQRLLNYHSAHDIGHALQDFRLVGCTSFGAWNDCSADSSLIIGRNFDFYMGDEFAENKIICFEKPDSGYAFMMVTWGGMIGTVSGMNTQGLTVTINAAKSEIPFSARTPISILSREILQYAKTIGEAFEIAKKRKTFVSESLLIGSGNENKAAVIEKSPFGISLYLPDRNYIICTNHFQSAFFQDDPLNRQNKRENASLYRYQRVLQDLTKNFPLDPTRVASILRDQKGLNDQDIGMGNEKAINQLISHHSIIFKPRQRKFWVSTTPWQIGPFVCYDLIKIFNNFAGLKEKKEITESGLVIPSDPFLETEKYKKFLYFREMKKVLIRVIREKQKVILNPALLNDFETANPNYYEVYSLTGDYYMKLGNFNLAGQKYRMSLNKIIPRETDKREIIKKLAVCNISVYK